MSANTANSKHVVDTGSLIHGLLNGPGVPNFEVDVASDLLERSAVLETILATCVGGIVSDKEGADELDVGIDVILIVVSLVKLVDVRLKKEWRLGYCCGEMIEWNWVAVILQGK